MPRMKYTKSSLKKYNQLTAEQKQFEDAAKAALKKGQYIEWKQNKMKAKALHKLINFYYIRAMFYGFQRK